MGSFNHWELIYVREIRSGDVISADEDALEAFSRQRWQDMDWDAVVSDAMVITSVTRTGARIYFEGIAFGEIIAGTAGTDLLALRYIGPPRAPRK
jgi:hypothetical protein